MNLHFVNRCVNPFHRILIWGSFLLLAQLCGPGQMTARASSHVCYEVFVASFRDSDGDRMGDLKGLTQELDYINDANPFSETDLECDMLWLMPVFPSPTYHKYDVTDYRSIDPSYGTMEDFDTLIAQCHARGIRVILDLPINHTSAAHPWFLQASDYLRSLPSGAQPSARECPPVEYYHFTQEPRDGYEPLEDTGWFYEARFWSGMPDLNLDNPSVRGEIDDILHFWLQKGVDGFRLDAVTSYYTEDLPANIAFLTWLNHSVKTDFPECYLVGEAWASSETYAQYYASGIDSLFDFDFAGPEGLIASLARGLAPASRYGERLMKEEALFASFSQSYSNAPFYTNHDMARSAGYYVRDDGSRVKLAQALNLLMPGQAFLYYGEELAMKGSGKDENKRAPMYWSDNENDPGMCAGPPDMDDIPKKYPSLQEQEDDPYSILTYVKQAIRLRDRFPALAEGTTQMVEALSGKEVCTLLRTAGEQNPVLLVINTSDQKQEIDLSSGGQPVSGFTRLSGQLHVSSNAAFLMERPDGARLSLPPFGIAVLTRASDGRSTDSICIVDH